MEETVEDMENIAEALNNAAEAAVVVVAMTSVAAVANTAKKDTSTIIIV